MTPAFREWLAVSVLVGTIPLAVVLTVATVALFPNWSVAILVALLVLGVAGVVAGDWPLIEYLLVLTIGGVIALLLLPHTLYGCCLPGAITGYLWGGYFSEIVDRPNTQRLEDEARLRNSESTGDSAGG